MFDERPFRLKPRNDVVRNEFFWPASLHPVPWPCSTACRFFFSFLKGLRKRGCKEWSERCNGKRARASKDRKDYAFEEKSKKDFDMEELMESLGGMGGMGGMGARVFHSPVMPCWKVNREEAETNGSRLFVSLSSSLALSSLTNNPSQYPGSLILSRKASLCELPNLDRLNFHM